MDWIEQSDLWSSMSAFWGSAFRPGRFTHARRHGVVAGVGRSATSDEQRCGKRRGKLGERATVGPRSWPPPIEPAERLLSTQLSGGHDFESRAQARPRLQKPAPRLTLIRCCRRGPGADAGSGRVLRMQIQIQIHRRMAARRHRPLGHATATAGRHRPPSDGLRSPTTSSHAALCTGLGLFSLSTA